MKLTQIIVISAFIVLALWLGLGYMTWHLFDSMELRGQAGDMFGLANSLFSALAFTAIIISLIYQHNSLKIEREDFKLTLEEARRSSEAAAEQAKILKDQLRLDLIRKEIETTTFLISQLSQAMSVRVESTATERFQTSTIMALAGQNSIDVAGEVLKKKYAQLEKLISSVHEEKAAQSGSRGR